MHFTALEAFLVSALFTRSFSADKYLNLSELEALAFARGKFDLWQKRDYKRLYSMNAVYFSRMSPETFEDVTVTFTEMLSEILECEVEDLIEVIVRDHSLMAAYPNGSVQYVVYLWKAHDELRFHHNTQFPGREEV